MTLTRSRTPRTLEPPGVRPRRGARRPDRAHAHRRPSRRWQVLRVLLAEWRAAGNNSTDGYCARVRRRRPRPAAPSPSPCYCTAQFAPAVLRQQALRPSRLGERGRQARSGGAHHRRHRRPSYPHPHAPPRSPLPPVCIGGACGARSHPAQLQRCPFCAEWRRGTHRAGACGGRGGGAPPVAIRPLRLRPPPSHAR